MSFQHLKTCFSASLFSCDGFICLCLHNFLPYINCPFSNQVVIHVTFKKPFFLKKTNRAHNASYQKTEFQRAFEEHCKSSGIIQEGPRRILSDDIYIILIM